MIAILLLGLALTGSVSGARSLAQDTALKAGANVVRGHLSYARVIAIARRENVRLTLAPGGDLLLTDSRDSVVRRTRLLGEESFHLDSVRLRPAVLRFNSRGQAAPASVYLHGRRGSIRLVVNFVGRVREEKLP
jgi:hypothetical protein